MSDLEKMTLVQLRTIAKELGLKNINKMRKNELMANLSNNSSFVVEEEIVEETIENHEIPQEVEEVLRVEESSEIAHITKNDRMFGAGILEIMADGYGFLRSQNFMRGENDIYVSISQIRRFNLKTGDWIEGDMRKPKEGEKAGALLYVHKVNGDRPEKAKYRPNFETLTRYFQRRDFN